LEELKGLKDEAHLLTPQLCELRVIKAGNGDSIQQNFTLARKVHCPSKIEQRRLATAAPADERDEATGRYIQRDAIERANASGLRRILLHDVVKAEQGRHVAMLAVFDFARTLECEVGSHPVKKDARFGSNVPGVIRPSLQEKQISL
jgi:hypothetical protein